MKVEDVKELLFYLDPLIRSQAGRAEAESLIKWLQETDGGLGQYRLTSGLRLRVREVMLDSIREEVAAATLDRRLSPETMQELAPALLRSLSQGPRWLQLVAEVKAELGRASREVAETEGRLTPQPAGPSGPSSLGSTWQQANFLLLQPEQVGRLAGQMVGGEGEGEAARLEALNTLLLSQVSDITASQHWPAIKAGHRRCLADQNRQLAGLSLKFHARLVISGSHFAIKEGLINLLQTVSAWYSDKKLSSLLPLSGLTRDCHLHQAALDILSLALSMAADLPKTWIRFPQRFVEEIIESMIELLSLASLQGQYSPLSLLSLVDPEAGWLRAWLHSKISRTIFLRKLSGCRQLVKSVQQDIVTFIQETPFQHYHQLRAEITLARQMTELATVSGAIVEFGSFLHKINFLLTILTYQAGETVVEGRESLLASLLQLVLLPSTAAHPGKYLAMRLSRLTSRLNQELFRPFEQILADQESHSKDVILNALLIVSERAKHSPTSEEIFSSLCSVWRRFRTEPELRDLITSIARESSSFPVSFIFPDCRQLMGKIIEAGEGRELGGELDRSARIFYYDGMREIKFHDDHKRSYALSCRTRGGAELLVGNKVFMEKLSELSRLLHGEEAEGNKVICQFGEEEMEEKMQELQLLLSSDQFVVCHSKEGTGLSSLLPPDDSQTSPEWKVCRWRLLLTACSNLDSLLALEQKYQLSHLLHSAIKDCQQEDGIIVDEEFLYVRYIYNMIKTIGGPREMRRYSLTLSEEDEVEQPQRKCSEEESEPAGQSSALEHFLQDETRLLDLGWLESAGKMFRELVVSGGSLSSSQTVRLLEKFSASQRTAAATQSPRIEVITTTDDSLGLNMTIKYGTSIGVLSRSDEAGLKTRLAELLKISKSIFPVSSYDWFVSSVFLLTAGELRVSSDLLESLSDLLLCPLLWHNAAASRHQAFQLLTVGFATELIIDSELPALAAFLNLNNIPLSAVLDIWLRQCFINVLDFPDVKNFLLFGLMFGADYIVYFCVSVLHHIQADIIEQEEGTGLNVFQRILTQPVSGFSSVHYLPYMDILARKHKPVLMQYFTSMMEE